MASFNKVILIGNLTRDPELRYTPKGTAVARIGLAVGRNWRDESGQMHEETAFIDIDAFGKQAETIGQYLKKGRPVMIEGRLRLDTWDDKTTGQKRSKLLVVLENFQFLDSGRNRDEQSSSGEGGYQNSQGGGYASSGPAPGPAPRTPNPGPASGPAETSADDDDVPF